MKIINKQVAWGLVTLIAIGVVFLAGNRSRASEDYITIKTPIVSHSMIMDYSWCDNEHLLVRKKDDEAYQKTIKTTRTSEFENKLHYIDVTGKTEVDPGNWTEF